MDVIISSILLNFLIFMNHMFLIRGQGFKNGKLHLNFNLHYYFYVGKREGGALSVVDCVFNTKITFFLNESNVKCF